MEETATPAEPAPVAAGTHECPECGAVAIDCGGECYRCPKCGRKF